MKPDLRVNIGRLKLKNPVMVASGTFGYAEEFGDFLDLKQLGAIATKTITLRPRQGNPVPRTCETPAGMLNSIGLENPGIEVFLSRKLPGLLNIGVPIIVSISAQDDPGEFIHLTRRLDKVKKVAALELNISCPNLGKQRLIAQDPQATCDLLKRVRRITSKTLIVKLSPNVTDISEIARAAERGGADGLSLVNTFYGMSIDTESRKPKLANVIGGLSGPAIKPIALAMTWAVCRKVKIPVIGMGGIISTQDALEFLIAGARAISIGTANFIYPKLSAEIIRGIREYLVKNRIRNIACLNGALKR